MHVCVVLKNSRIPDRLPNTSPSRQQFFETNLEIRKTPLIVNIVTCCHQACWKQVLCWTTSSFRHRKWVKLPWWRDLYSVDAIARLGGPGKSRNDTDLILDWKSGMPKTETWKGETSSFWYHFWERISLNPGNMRNLTAEQCHCPTLFTASVNLQKWST